MNTLTAWKVYKYGESRRLICTRRNWKLSQTEFLTKNADLFLKMFFLQSFFHIFTIANELTGFSISTFANMEDSFKRHCVKIVQIRNYFWSVFFSIRTEYGEIKSGKYGPEINPYLDTFRNLSLHKRRIYPTLTSFSVLPFLSLPMPKSVYVWPQLDNDVSTWFP